MSKIAILFITLTSWSRRWSGVGPPRRGSGRRARMERVAGRAASWRRPAPSHSCTRDNGWGSPCRTPSGRSAGNRWCLDRTSLRRSPRPFRWTSWLTDLLASWPGTGQWSNEPNRPTNERARENAYAKKTLNFTLDSKCNKKLFYKKTLSWLALKWKRNHSSDTRSIKINSHYPLNERKWYYDVVRKWRVIMRWLRREEKEMILGRINKIANTHTLALHQSISM